MLRERQYIMGHADPEIWAASIPISMMMDKIIIMRKLGFRVWRLSRNTRCHSTAGVSLPGEMIFSETGSGPLRQNHVTFVTSAWVLAERFIGLYKKSPIFREIMARLAGSNLRPFGPEPNVIILFSIFRGFCFKIAHLSHVFVTRL